LLFLNTSLNCLFLIGILDIKNSGSGWVLVAHAYNPSYTRDTDQEDCGSRLAQENSSRDTISKIPNTKKGLAKWLDCRVPT
jgi:hypothetical protein